MEVKTFDEKKLKALMKECDPYLLKYIEALKNSSASWERLTQEAIKKLRESAPNSDYAKCSKCGCQIESSLCGKCSFPTYDNTAKKHFA